jgi:hypothetical protein
MQLFRRATVPDAVKAVPLPPGERRIAWALTTQGQPVVASSRGLYLPGVPPLPWDGIERVHWDQPLLSVLELTERAGSGQRHHVELDLAHDTDLPETVRTRVTASVAWSTHVKLQPAGGVRVVGRPIRRRRVCARRRRSTSPPPAGRSGNSTAQQPPDRVAAGHLTGYR